MRNFTLRKLTPKQAAKHFKGKFVAPKGTIFYYRRWGYWDIPAEISRFIKDTKDLTPAIFREIFGKLQVYRKKYAPTMWIDIRTRWESYSEESQRKYPAIYPFAMSETQVFIVCPFCCEIHSHGNKKGDYAGMRVSHCRTTDNRPEYCIKELPEK